MPVSAPVEPPTTRPTSGRHQANEREGWHGAQGGRSDAAPHLGPDDAWEDFQADELENGMQEARGPTTGLTALKQGDHAYVLAQP